MDERIEIHRKPKGFTIIQNSIIRDTSISPNARILVITMLSLPENYNITVKGLCTIINGKDNEYHGYKISTIYNYFQELQQAGYLIKEQKRDEKGHFKWVKYHVYEEKLDDQEKELEPSLNSNLKTDTHYFSTPKNEKYHCEDGSNDFSSDNDLTDDEVADFECLCVISVNKNNISNEHGKQKTFKEFEKLMKNGVKSNEVLLAWKRHQEKLDRDQKFMPQLKRWLSNEAIYEVKQLQNTEKWRIDEAVNKIYGECGEKRFDENKIAVCKTGFCDDGTVSFMVWKNTPQKKLNEMAKAYFEKRK